MIERRLSSHREPLLELTDRLIGGSLVDKVVDLLSQDEVLKFRFRRVAGDDLVKNLTCWGLLRVGAKLFIGCAFRSYFRIFRQGLCPNSKFIGVFVHLSFVHHKALPLSGRTGDRR